MPTNFQLTPTRFDGGLPPTGCSSNFASSVEQRPLRQDRPNIETVASASLTHVVSPVSPKPSGILHPSLSFPAENLTEDNHIDHVKEETEKLHDTAYLRVEPQRMADPYATAQYKGSTSGAELSPVVSPTDIGIAGPSRMAPLPPTPPEKGKSKWRLKFAATRKPSVGTSADSSSLSSTAIEAQKLEEIPLGALHGLSKTSSRAKGPKSIHVELSKTSTLALFWAQQTIHVWDVGPSPPVMTRSILTESTCILAAVAKLHLAYVIGTRDQRLTVPCLGPSGV